MPFKSSRRVTHADDQHLHVQPFIHDALYVHDRFYDTSMMHIKNGNRKTNRMLNCTPEWNISVIDMVDMVVSFVFWSKTKIETQPFQK